MALAFSIYLDGFRMDEWTGFFFSIDDACMKIFLGTEKMGWDGMVAGWSGVGGVVCLCLERAE